MQLSKVLKYLTSFVWNVYFFQFKDNNDKKDDKKKKESKDGKSTETSGPDLSAQQGDDTGSCMFAIFYQWFYWVIWCNKLYPNNNVPSLMHRKGNNGKNCKTSYSL